MWEKWHRPRRPNSFDQLCRTSVERGHQSVYETHIIRGYEHFKKKSFPSESWARTEPHRGPVRQ
jgi:hypothetical protein